MVQVRYAPSFGKSPDMISIIGKIAEQTTFSDLVIKVREVRPGIWESD